MRDVLLAFSCVGGRERSLGNAGIVVLATVHDQRLIDAADSRPTLA
jgi:hypothetical protein